MTRRTNETTCVGLDDFGKGIVRIDGTTAFVDNLLPGEKALVTTDFSYGKLYSAKVEERLTSSPDRVKPLCRYYPSCGGCQIMHLSYEKQLEYKTKKVQDLLHKFAKLDIDVKPCIGLADPTRFRNKVQKPVRWDMKHQKIKAGFYQSGTHNLIGIDDCLMESELSNRISKTLVELLAQFRYTPYHEDSQIGEIRHLLIKTNSDQTQALVTLIVTTSKLYGIRDFAKALIRRVPEVVGVVLNINTRKTNVILGPYNIPVYGRLRIADKIFDKTFLVSTNAFYQVNAKQVETLYQKAIEAADLQKSDHLLDAYCGTGTIGLSCADKVAEVTGVELVADAVHDAILNAKINNVKNAHFLKADCTQYLASTDKHFDVIIMDPPRKGSTPEFIAALKRIAPSRLVYVSCDPSTLARDLSLLKDTYVIQSVQPVDMFPNSMHVETVVLLSKKNGLKRPKIDKN